MAHDPLVEALYPETWVRFAAAALQALVSMQAWQHLPEEKTQEYVALQAARYADALSREYARRFITIVGSKEPR